MEDRILKLFKTPDAPPLSAAEMIRRLGVSPEERHEFSVALGQLERSGQIARIKKDNRYALPREADLIPGRIRINRQGGGILQPDDPNTEPIRIPQDATATAMNGDRTLVRKDVISKPVKRPGQLEQTGRVVRVLERARTTLVGTLEKGRQFFYVIPDDPRMPQDIYVPEPRDVGRLARPGDKVVVEIGEWKSRHISPEGEVIEVLGPPDAEGVDMFSVIRNYNLPLHFPKRVLTEARSFGLAIKPEELAGRLDCREHLVVTIDPPDAKDFDDAICLQRINRDQWRLFVHIADVSHYVKPGTALDQEASERGNSTYLVDRVIPMLPEALSNELCSLKPNVDRLTKCVEFVLSSEGRVLESTFHSAVIHSKRRYNYKEVFALLQREATDDPIERMLHSAHAMAQKIRKARFRAGSLSLDFPETKIILNEAGEVERIEKVLNDVSHQLIEEFMLLANEAVAGKLMELDRPAVYRIHEPPDEKRLREFREEVLGHGLPCGNLANRHEVQKLLALLDTLPIGAALKVGFLRSLMRARYAVQPIGHYGLAKKKYTHFTSPIRRYADLLVHRALFDPRSVNAHRLSAVADHISETERNSDDAERDSRDVKLFAFLNKQLESRNLVVYDAVITDLRNFGFFVDVIGLGMSGLVHLSGMTDDFYVLDTAQHCLVGRRTRQRIQLGDKVRVQVAKVDVFKKQVDFRLARPLARSEKRHITQGPAGRQRTPSYASLPRLDEVPHQGKRHKQHKSRDDGRPDFDQRRHHRRRSDRKRRFR